MYTSRAARVSPTTPTCELGSVRPTGFAFRELSMRNSRSRASLVLIGAVLAPLAVATAEAQMAWNAVAPMATGRTIFSMTALQDGRVLVVGGQSNTILRSCEIFDPTTGAWSETGQLSGPRANHATVRLLDGRVLAVGGGDGQDVLNTAEIFDPSTEEWTLAPPPARSSYNPVALLLNGGRVFLLHSWGTEAEIFDPNTETWSDTSSMGPTRTSATATLLADGRVLVAGGYASGTGATTALVYDPVGDTWLTTGLLATSRRRPLGDPPVEWPSAGRGRPHYERRGTTWPVRKSTTLSPTPGARPERWRPRVTPTRPHVSPTGRCSSPEAARTTWPRMVLHPRHLGALPSRHRPLLGRSGARRGAIWPRSGPPARWSAAGGGGLEERPSPER